MDWLFALTMFGIGAVLKIEDFKRIAAKPVIVLIGSCAQFTFMPLGAFALSKIFNLPPEVAVGLILTGSSIDDVVRSFPSLSRAQIYECMAYYEDHKSELDLQIAQQMAEAN